MTLRPTKKWPRGKRKRQLAQKKWRRLKPQLEAEKVVDQLSDRVKLPRGRVRQWVGVGSFFHDNYDNLVYIGESDDEGTP